MRRGEDARAKTGTPGELSARAGVSTFWHPRRGGRGLCPWSLSRPSATLRVSHTTMAHRRSGRSASEGVGTPFPAALGRESARRPRRGVSLSGWRIGWPVGGISAGLSGTVERRGAKGRGARGRREVESLVRHHARWHSLEPPEDRVIGRISSRPHYFGSKHCKRPHQRPHTLSHTIYAARARRSSSVTDEQTHSFSNHHDFLKSP